MHALKIGYRLIDTAQMYKNETEVGEAIRASQIPRESIFVVTKLSSDEHGRTRVSAALRESLKRLGLSYVDLFLIHSPKPGKVLETWKEMLSLKKEGLAKSVGVSNFGVDQLEGLRNAKLEMPEVNQIEIHPWLQQKKCREYMKMHSIAPMGYCPLGRCKQFGKTEVKDVASARKKSEAQICIRWSVQSGIVTIPKSSKPTRIAENADIFDWSLSQSEMKTLESVDCGFRASNSVRSMDIPWTTVA